MELNELFTVEAHEAGAKVEILHPATGEKTGVKIHVIGADSRKFRQIVRDRQRQRLEGTETDEQRDARDLDMLVKATLGWEGLVKGGQPLPFSPEMARQLFDQSPGVRAQVDAFIFNRSNFTKG